MARRWTRDTLAVVVTAVFLLWVVSDFFIPLWYFPLRNALWGAQGETILGSDILAAVVCVFAYVLAGRNLPERIAPHGW